jgi:hypothetical protein
MVEKYPKAKPRTSLWWIGIWATAWWGVSFLYITLLVWSARNRFIDISDGKASNAFWSDWGHAISQNYQAEKGLRVLAVIIIAVWALGTYIWFSELKREYPSYKAAFKSLFFKVR